MNSTSKEAPQNMEVIKKKLFRSAMKGDWDEVVKTYMENENARKIKITKSEETALHVAVSDDQAGIVEDLLNIIKDDPKGKEALEIKNERGNTSLHFAASMGNVKMCKCIAGIHKDLIGARNEDGETPLFLAALHGRKEAFLCLDEICGREKGATYCRRKDGDTILHCAIAGEYFDLAFQIICRYKELVNSVNEHGFYPLHLLATKYSAFRSGSHFRWFENIIYHCIFVKELNEERFKMEKHAIRSFEEEKNPSYPQNYQTCINFSRLPWLALTVLFDLRSFLGTNSEQGDHHQTKAGNTSGQPDLENPNGNQSNKKGKESLKNELFPTNYWTCFNGVKFVSKAMLIILGVGFKDVKKIKEKKEKHVWAAQILDKLLHDAHLYEYEDNGGNPEQSLQRKDSETTPTDYYTEGDQHPTASIEARTSPISSNAKVEDQSSTEDERKQKGDDKPLKMQKKETPILVAAKNGVVEIVHRILELFPVAIHDKNFKKKNIVLLAVEHRQPHVYELLLGKKFLKETVFRQVDICGNSAIHLAAKLGENKPWLIPGAALQMQWEIKWYKFVKKSMPPHFFARSNINGETAKDIFTKEHESLVEAGGKWLSETSQSCSVVAALIATVAFTTAATVPGGVKENVGRPNLEDEPGFDIFAISSLVALCSSVTAVVMFLAILTSRYQERDFGTDLPRKLLVGLTSLFVSVASMFVSFCAGHYFVLKDKLKYTALPLYVVTCLPVTFFAMAQFSLYFDLIWATIKRVPRRSYRVAPL